nr:GSTkappa3 protein [Diaphanosoma celebensis]
MAGLLRTKVELFYDVISPYSWFSFETLCRYRQFWNMDLSFRPVLLGGLFKLSGNKSPFSIPAKELHLKKDWHRNGVYFQVPLNVIEDPFHILAKKGSLRAQRLITAVQFNHPSYVEEVSRQLWLRTWSEGKDITEYDSLWEAAQNAKMDGATIDKCIRLIDDPKTKKGLEDSTAEAFTHGAFGAPTIVVHLQSGPEMFFGADRFPVMAMVMNEKWKGPQPN